MLISTKRFPKHPVREVLLVVTMAPKKIHNLCLLGSSPRTIELLLKSDKEAHGGNSKHEIYGSSVFKAPFLIGCIWKDSGKLSRGASEGVTEQPFAAPVMLGFERPLKPAERKRLVSELSRRWKI